MEYCGGSTCSTFGSSASPSAVSTALDSFDYSSSDLRLKSNYSDTAWMDSLKADLDNGYPIFYSGYTSNYKYGHGFVCDGYDNNNKFHFNWGWNGNYDGYFALSSLNPSTHNYATGQCAVFHIHPKYCWD